MTLTVSCGIWNLQDMSCAVILTGGHLWLCASCGKLWFTERARFVQEDYLEAQALAAGVDQTMSAISGTA